MTNTVAEKIKKLRKTKGFSQEQMAEKLSISQSAYARLETGESNSWANYIVKLGEIFDVKPDYFFSDDSNNFNNQNQEQNGGMAFQFVGTINTINSLSEKLIEQYEERILELKSQIKELQQALLKK